MARHGLEGRISRLEARQALSRRCGGIVCVPLAPGQDIHEVVDALGLLDGLTGNVALLPEPISTGEWQAYVEAEQAWCCAAHACSAFR